MIKIALEFELAALAASRALETGNIVWRQDAMRRLVAAKAALDRLPEADRGRGSEYVKSRRRLTCPVWQRIEAVLDRESL